MTTQQKIQKFEAAWGKYICTTVRLETAYKTGNGNNLNGARRACRAAKRQLRDLCAKIGEASPV